MIIVIVIVVIISDAYSFRIFAPPPDRAPPLPSEPACRRLSERVDELPDSCMHAITCVSMWLCRFLTTYLCDSAYVNMSVCEYVIM